MTAPRLAPGQAVAGKYVIRAMLGHSGATATFTAQAASGKDVVVKLFSSQLSQRPDALGALQQVTTVTNALGDAAMPILESGFDPQTGAPFLVTDLSPIPSLAQTVGRGPLSPSDVLLLLQGIARAVDAARGQGVVHGALKPTNVFIGHPPQRGVRVGDFGVAIARAAHPTNEGFAVAAPWLAPEQLQGAPGSPGADVFSAALLAFYAATGRSYWRSCQETVFDFATLQQELGAPRVPPSARARELGAYLVPAYDSALLRALSANPAERFASIGELAEALGNASGHAQPANMTMPLAALPQAAQDAFRHVAPAKAPVAPPAPAFEGGKTMPIHAVADMPWLASLGQPSQQAQSPAAVPGAIPSIAQPPMVQPYAGYPVPAPAPPEARSALAQPGPEHGATAQPAPSLAPGPVSMSPPKSRAGLFVVLAIVGLAIAAGAVVLVAFMRQRAVSASLPPAATAAPARPVTAAAITPPATATALPSAPLDAATTNTGGLDASSATAATAPEAGSAPDQAELTIVCMPECESVKIDDTPLETTDAGFVSHDPLQLAPGPHTLVAGRASYLAQTKKLTLKAGQKAKQSFFLQKPGVAAVAPKPCGKFLERCPN